jgi:hypothetical protein
MKRPASAHCPRTAINAPPLEWFLARLSASCDREAPEARRTTLIAATTKGDEQGTLGHELRSFIEERQDPHGYETLQSMQRPTWLHRTSEVDAAVLLEVLQEGIRT